MKTVIVFETEKEINVHELLCLAIHEGDSEALDTLIENVANISEGFSNIVIEATFDLSGYHGLEGFTNCQQFNFLDPVDEENEAVVDDYVNTALESLQRKLGYRFDEDSWFQIDWRDDTELWIHYNIPYEARRLPI